MTRLFKRSTGKLAPLVAIVLNCGKGAETTQPLFKQLAPNATGITFANTIPTSDSINVLTNVYLYNGGGVGVGDIDNDGLSDVFFTGNMVSSRLYLNRGNMRFEDITQSAGVATTRWASGVSLVDINGDGYLDIYLSMSGPPWATPEDTRNLLFINNRNRTFTESAKAYGIDDSGFTAHAVFFDYDGDRDLDLFLLGNSPQDFARSQLELHPAGLRRQSSAGQDRLYRNNGNATFTDVSREAGILTEAQFGLGVVVNDFNRDGWPDLYLSNDDLADDVLYINNRNGTFTDRSGTWFKHTSFAGMGIDAADFNNDGWPDIMQTDMMPEDAPTRKRMSGAVTAGDQAERRQRGYHDAYTQNTLQLSNGLTSSGDLVFSDIARMAGVAYTHWSWAAVFGDCDDDGYKDLFVTNGYPKAVTDFDYQTRMFRLHQTEQNLDTISPQRLKIIKELPTFSVSNYMFRNNRDLTFTNTTREWGLDQPGFSYGAALADLNNDGKLDLVVNNIDAPASVYQNVGPAGVPGHYLDIVLRGEAPNTQGIGAVLTLVAGGERQYLYHTPYHGYLSSMAEREHFGLGATTQVDSLIIVWPDGRSQTLTDLAVDRLVTVNQSDAKLENRGRATDVAPAERPLFQRMAPNRAPRYKQAVLGYTDFAIQPLLPNQVSRQGPPLAVGDANGDGLDDLFVGGVPGTPGKLFVQHPDGRLTESSQEQPWARDRGYQDWGALFFDANGDGRLDLYVASGGYHFSPISAFLQDRLYINEGGGRYARDSAALPVMLTSTAAVAAGDFNADGKPDLFVGGRLAPRNYPYPARSYVLRNDGGRFTDVTEHVAPELGTPGGMITGAVWIDFDGDGHLDLVTAGDWMPLQFFKKEGQHFRNVTESMGIGPTRGRWLSLATGDFNRDGHPDLVAGNLGQNHTYRTSRDSRFGIIAGDYTGVRRTDIILTKEIDGTEYPWYGFAMLGKAVYTIGLRFPNHAAFSHASIRDILSPSQIAGSLHYQADTFASLYLQSTGQGTFIATPLPSAAQIAPVRGIVVTDVDGDGNLDLLVAGNLYDTEPNTPPADAGNGSWLRGDGRGYFTAVSPRESGFLAPGNVTGLNAMKTPAGTAVLVANHGDSLSAFVIRRR
ncbi:MAG TPA: VCBS repeat-containing protein [Gemmatimonadales bacterium]|nr:VCBS repeat-containing protein [Gemmatimonadales bacterium]